MLGTARSASFSRRRSPNFKIVFKQMNFHYTEFGLLRVELNPRLLVEKLWIFPGIRVDAVSTWVDVARFLDDFSSIASGRIRFAQLRLPEVGMSPEGLTRVLETWIDQIEFVDTILMNTDRVGSEEFESVKSILKTPSSLRPKSSTATMPTHGLIAYNRGGSFIQFEV